jgi:formate dehydrogenase major subunit
MLASLFSKWPLVRQILNGADGNGLEAMSPRTRQHRARIDGAEVARSICPYCGVGCGQLIFHSKGKLLAIEGDPESPISQGTLCPKGAASHQLLTHGKRITKIRYRKPFASHWTDLDIEVAMEMIADRVWESRRRTFLREHQGQRVNQVQGIGSIGGATLDIEENYLIKKLFTAGLGMVRVSNQARI